MSTRELKDTINLPSTKFPMRGNLPQREPARIDHWHKTKLYEKIQEKNNNGETFVLHDGPPFTNGDVHIGTALNKLLKDIILKYKSMKGFATPYVPGWDCHGLPIEHKVVKILREEKKELSLADLRNECAKFSASFIEKQRAQFKRLGVLASWENEYKTMNPSYEADIIRTFAAFVKRGLVFRSKKPVYWSIPCKTALAEAEIEYQDIYSSSIWVSFNIDENDKARLNLPSQTKVVIWTTTPWTLPANMAVAVHPNLDYCVIKSDEGEFLVGKDLADKFIKDCKLNNAGIVFEIKGALLENAKAFHPFVNRISPFVLADYITTDSGTGVVHTAPGHGMEDYLTGLKYKLEIYCPVSDEGTYVDDGMVPSELVGVSVLDNKGKCKANDMVLDILKEKGALLNLEKILHSYPHCWRSKTPVIFRALDQWFVSLDKVRQVALDEIEKVSFEPANAKNRISAAVELRPDWCISRQRVWGVPIPAFYDEEKNPYLDASVIEQIADKVEKDGTNLWFEKTEEEILDGIDLPESWKGKKLIKSTDTLDVWIDSGSSHRAVLQKRPDLKLTDPADLYLEGSDQHRGWFQSSLWTGVIADDKAPYKKVITHGFIVDEQRKKISKSDGKPQTADSYVNKYGADIVRLWLSSEDYRQDIPISENILKHTAASYRSIRNTLMYQLGNLSDFNFEKDAVDFKDMDALDKWALHKMALLIKNVDSSYENYEFHKAYQLIDRFVGVTLSRYYHDILKDRLYTFAPSWTKRKSSQTAIYYIISALLKISAPILPFTAEEAFAQFKGSENEFDENVSIFLEDFPSDYDKFLDDENYNQIEKVLEIREKINEILENLRKEKVIGKSLEASVLIKANEELYNTLKANEEILAEIFIVSKLTLELTQGEFSIEAGKAQGDRCPRCWRIVKDLVPADGFEEKVCPRCQKALADTFTN